MEKQLAKEREKWERRRQMEMQVRGALRRSRSRSRSPMEGWLQRATKRRGAWAGVLRGSGRGGGRAVGSGLQHSDIPYLSSGQEGGILDDVMPVYIKEGFSRRQAIFAVASVLVASGADLDNFSISVGSCHRSVVEHREGMTETQLSRFATEAKNGNVPLVVHFDGKQ